MKTHGIQFWRGVLPLSALLVAQGCASSDSSEPAGNTGGATAQAGQGGSTGAGAGGAAGNTSAGGAGSGGMSAGGSATALRGALETDGFMVQEGAFSFLDLSACCQTSCLGNNPTSPYGAFFVPGGPGQTAENTNTGADGRSATYRLRADEALVYVGKTPPRARYFGFTPYLSERHEGSMVLRPLASLSETLNNAVIGVDGGPDVFDKPVVVIASLDEGIDGRVRAALEAAGYPKASMNSLVFDPTVARPGLDEQADSFGVLFRMAVLEDSARGQAYRDAPPGILWRLTPTTPAPAQPFAAPKARPKDLTHTEKALEPAVNALEQALAQAYPDHVGKTMVTTAGTPDPGACIAGKDACAYDNRDTIYPATLPQKLLDQPGEFLIVYGVNHETTGKASYGNASVYGLQHLVGVASVTSAQYGGSAASLLPNNPDAPGLYAWKIARDCGGDPACLEVSTSGCPEGVPVGGAMDIAFRVYLEPSTGTAADPSTLVIDRVMRFQKK
jgi:hypothetical protein